MITKLINKLFKFDPDSIRSLSIRSAVWSILSKGGGDIIRLAGNLLLTRILFPEAFGLLATANVLLMMVQLFSDTGVKTAIIQNPRGSEVEFLNTVWIINIIRGIILCSVIFISAWPLSIFYQEPHLKNILFIMCLGPLLFGFENPALPLLVKNFEIHRQFKMDIITQVVALVTTVILAFILKSVYALAIGYTLSNCYRLVATYCIIPFRPHFSWDKDAGKELFNFGKYVFLNTMITVVVYELDVLLIGKMLNMETLSFYNIGKNLGSLMFVFFSQIIVQSFLPAISTVQKDHLHVQRIYQKTTALFLTLAVPASVLVMLFSHDIIALLYDPRYQLAYISMSWFAIAGVFRIIGQVSGATFLATGKPALEMKSMAAGSVILIASLFAGITSGDIYGASCGVAVAVSIIPVIKCVFLKRIMKFPLRIVVMPYLQIFVVAGISVLIYYVIKPWAGNGLYYRIIFIVLMSLFSFGISSAVYFYLKNYSIKNEGNEGSQCAVQLAG